MLQVRQVRVLTTRRWRGSIRHSIENTDRLLGLGLANRRYGHGPFPEIGPPILDNARKRKDEDLWNTRLPLAKAQALSENAKAIVHEIESGRDALDVLRERVDQGILSDDGLVFCLSTLHRESQKLSQQQQVETARQHGVARLSLRHLWNRDDVGLVFVSKQPRAVQDLCYFAVLEGMEPLILQWVQAEPAEDAVSRLDRSTEHVWRGIVMASLVSAHGRMQPTCADAMLECLFGFVQLKRKLRAEYDSALRRGEKPRVPPIVYAASYPAIVQVMRFLRSGKCSDTNPKLYTDFMAFVANFGVKQEAGQLALTMAQLHLYHPTTPDALPVLEFFRQRFGNQSADEARQLLPKDPIIQRSMQTTLYRAKAVLRTQRQNSSLHELTALSERLFPRETPLFARQSARPEQSNPDASTLTTNKGWRKHAPFRTQHDNQNASGRRSMCTTSKRSAVGSNHLRDHAAHPDQQIDDRASPRGRSVAEPRSWSRKPPRSLWDFNRNPEAYQAANIPSERLANEGSLRWQVPSSALSPEARMIQSELCNGQRSLTTVLDQYLAQPSTPLDALYVCLDYSMESLKKLPRGKRFRQLTESTTGSRILKYLWAHDKKWLKLVHREMAMMNLLIYHLVGEGHEDLIVDWLHVQLSPDAEEEAENFHDKLNTWRGMVLRSAIWAHLILDDMHSADSAIQCFFSIVEKRVKIIDTRHPKQEVETMRDPILRLSVFPAAVQIESALCSGEYYNTSAPLFSRFLRYRRAMKTKQDATTSELINAKMHIYHTGGPHARPMVSFLRQHFANVSTAEARSRLPTSPLATQHFERMAVRAVEVSERNGLSEDARFIESLIAELFDGVEVITRAEGLIRKVKHGPE